MSQTFVVSAAVLFLSFSAQAQSRSAVAGTWAASFTFGSGPDVHVCSGMMHLSGSDEALTGAAVCRISPFAAYYSASVSGELDGRLIRLNVTGNTSAGGFSGGSCVIDLTLAPDGQSAAGTGTGFGPAFGTVFNYDSYAVTLTAS
jgi:hypothetical protein